MDPGVMEGKGGEPVMFNRVLSVRGAAAGVMDRLWGGGHSRDVVQYPGCPLAAGWTSQHGVVLAA